MAINWNYVGHIIVGTIITAAQATALADPNPTVVVVCHVVSLVAIQVGSMLGVWQVSQLGQARATMALMAKPTVVNNTIVSPLATEVAPAPEASKA